MANGGDNLGGFGQPGQREITKRDYATEIKAPDQHAIRLFVALLIALTTLGCVAVVLGPGLAYVAGFAAILYVAGRLIFHYARRRETAPWWVMIGTVSALVAWGAWGWQACEWFWPPVRVEWPVWAKAAVVMIAVFAFAPVLVLYGYRRSYEIADPNHSSPRTAIDRTKPVMPWSPETRDFPPEEPRQPEQRALLRPVPVYEGGKRRTITLPEGSVDNGADFEGDSGKDRDTELLRQFVREAPVVGTSFSSVWGEPPRSWHHELWGDVVRALHQMGILNEIRERHKPTWHRQVCGDDGQVDAAKAAEMLEEFLQDGRKS